MLHQCESWEEARFDACLVKETAVANCAEIKVLLNGSAMLHSGGETDGLPDLSLLPTKYLDAIDGATAGQSESGVDIENCLGSFIRVEWGGSEGEMNCSSP